MTGTAFTVWSAAEAEFGEPFWDVLRGFAEQGCTRKEVAGILGYRSYPGFCKLLRNHPEQAIPWPKVGSGDSHRACAKAKAMIAAEARAAQFRVHLVDGIRDSVRGHAARRGLNPRTVHGRLKRGWSLERALSEPPVSFAEGGRRARAKWTQSRRAHPWSASA